MSENIQKYSELTQGRIDSFIYYEANCIHRCTTGLQSIRRGQSVQLAYTLNSSIVKIVFTSSNLGVYSILLFTPTKGVLECNKINEHAVLPVLL